MPTEFEAYASQLLQKRTMDERMDLALQAIEGLIQALDKTQRMLDRLIQLELAKQDRSPE